MSATKEVEDASRFQESELHPDVQEQRDKDVWRVCLGLRIVNAITLATFFQPDEYFQALEPAWALAFGNDSGAWITWEWHNQLRSSLHPMLLAGIYGATAGVSWIIGFPHNIRTNLLIVAPKACGAVIAALTDYYTWRLAQRLFGNGSRLPGIALTLSCLSPFQWFVSTRSLVNSLEASLTTIALYNWPWSLMMRRMTGVDKTKEIDRTKVCATFAMIASILRPTNLIIWATLTICLLPYLSIQDILTVTQNASVYGSAVLVLSNGLDRLFYGVWTFPAARFLKFNLTQDLAVFYGRNRLDYYFTEGLPILLTTVLPFAIAGMISAPSKARQRAQAREGVPANKTASEPNISNSLPLLAMSVAAVAYPLVLSLISHKEVRFLHPLLPIFIILSAGPIDSWFAPFPSPRSNSKRLLLGLLIVLTSMIALYPSYIHNRGPIAILSYLRTQFKALNPEATIFGMIPNSSLLTMLRGLFNSHSTSFWESQSLAAATPLTAAFLMPCHSTPWRSHLTSRDLRAWALTCEPPLDVPAGTLEREQYLDEADIFYQDPALWLRKEMAPVPHNGSIAVHEHDSAIKASWRKADSTFGEATPSSILGFSTWQQSMGNEIARNTEGERLWPQYVIFFEQLEPVIREVLGSKDSVYAECHRQFSTHWHDDWRRKGDIVVWCRGEPLDVKQVTRQGWAGIKKMREGQ